MSPPNPPPSARPMRVLTFTTLYPNAAEPNLGIFVENRIRRLASRPEIELKVIAPVRWFPSGDPRFGAYSVYGRAPRAERRHEIDIVHPRFPLIPKVGMTLAPILLYSAMRGLVTRAVREWGGVDLIDAHYFYPDGVAAALLARKLGLPVVITARGTDVNLIPDYATPRRMVRWAARNADGIVTVATALKQALVELGAAESNVTVLRNGVDLELFTPPRDREAARARLGLTRKTAISVGGLVERKGHHLIVEALGELPELDLLIAGEGPERARLEAQIAAAGLSERVRLLGAVPHDALAEAYGAADLLILASSREGWANVLLEAMACGTPVAATAIWGTPEVVRAPEAGRLIPERSPAHITATVRALLADPPERAQTRTYAEGFSWDETTQGQIDLFRDILARRREIREAA